MVKEMATMSDAYMPKPECPECGRSLAESAKKCPHCDTELVMCERGGHLVAKDNYRADVGMCNICWDDTTASH